MRRRGGRGEGGEEENVFVCWFADLQDVGQQLQMLVHVPKVLRIRM